LEKDYEEILAEASRMAQDIEFHLDKLFADDFQ
jgi:hypothetical protein